MDNDSLFALKLYYEDEYQDEHDIIRMLKIELINQGMQEDEANTKLKEFYDSFGYEIDIEIIKKTQIIRPSDVIINTIFNNLVNRNIVINEEENEEENDEENDHNTTLGQFLFNIITHQLVSHTEDVVSTLNEEDINKLKKYILEKDLEDKCTICLDCMETSQEVIELPCAHTYHSNCINEYLKKYSYKCPCCKIELGTPVHNI
jgi:E3 ubiquitin-protein ligase BIG BROTHER-like protein